MLLSPSIQRREEYEDEVHTCVWLEKLCNKHRNITSEI